MAMLFIPNIVWTKHKKQGYSAEKENRVLAVFEGVGQILVTCAAVFFSDFNIRPEFPGLLLLAASFTGMILSVLILGIGHIGIHREHYKEAENEFMKNRRGEEM